MRRTPIVARRAVLGAVVLLGLACKTYVYPPEEETKMQVVQLTQLLEQHLVLGKCLPSTMDAWISEDASVRKNAKDGWGRPFVLRSDDRYLTVVSAGFDGVFGSDDDVEGDAVVAPNGVPSCSPPEVTPPDQAASR